MSDIEHKPRRVWIALLLSLIGCPLGHVYCGYFRRALVFWGVGIVSLPAFAFCCVTFPQSQAGFVALALLLISFPFVQAFDAVRLARRRPTVARKSYQRWWVYLGIYVLCSIANYADAFFTKTYIAEVFQITSRAMAPTLLNGDRVLVDKFWTTPKRMTRNDIVVYQSVGDDSLHIMRSVALAGDDVQIQNGKFLLNGIEASVSNAHFDGELPSGDYSSKPDINNVSAKVQRDSFYVLGDNRNMSFDSRWVGAIPNDNLYGTVVNIVWSRPQALANPYALRPQPAKSGPIAWSRIGLPLR